MSKDAMRSHFIHSGDRFSLNIDRLGTWMLSELKTRKIYDFFWGFRLLYNIDMQNNHSQDTWKTVVKARLSCVKLEGKLAIGCIVERCSILLRLLHFTLGILLGGSPLHPPTPVCYISVVT